MLAEGKGIAHARALLESTPDVCCLNVPFRSNVRLFYKVPNDASICYKDRFDDWEATGCKTVVTTKTLQDAFEDDDTFAYDPDYTGAIILSECIVFLSFPGMYSRAAVSNVVSCMLTRWEGAAVRAAGVALSTTTCQRSDDCAPNCFLQRQLSAFTSYKRRMLACFSYVMY